MGPAVGPSRLGYGSPGSIELQNIPFCGTDPVMDVAGVAERAKLDEMRAHNIELRRKLEELSARFDGVDVEAAREAMATKKRLEEEAALKAGEFDKVLAARVESVRADLGKRLSETAAERDALNERLAAIQIDQALVAAATKRGLRATAIPDITARARTVFRVADGVARAFEHNGTTVRMGADGVTPLTLDEWVALQGSEAPHLFESNAGGGASGDGGGAAGGARKNPFRKGADWNLTEQMRLLKTEPALAARLSAAA